MSQSPTQGESVWANIKTIGGAVVLALVIRTCLFEPFEIEEWSLVVRLESLVPASFDEATAARMVQELFEQWLGLQVEQRLELLRGQILDPP